MHRYMRAIGFSSFESRKKLQELLAEVVMHPDRRAYAMGQEGRILGEFCKDFAKRMGVAVCGEFDEDE